MSSVHKLVINIDKVHTTTLGLGRIKRNLKLKSEDIVEYCKSIITNPECRISQAGKNWNCILDNVMLVVNSFSYTIITAHIIA